MPARIRASRPPAFRCGQRRSLPLLCRSSADFRRQQIVGTLAVLARSRPIQPEQMTLLETLGRQVVTRLELYSRIALQEQAQRAAADGAGAGHRALLCGGHAGLDSGAGAVLDTAGRVVRMNTLRATDGAEPGRRGGPAVCGGVSGEGDRAWARANCAMPRPDRSQRAARNGVARPWAAQAARELDAAAAAGTDRRDSVPDCERAGCDRPARDGEGAALERSALSRGGGEQLGFVFTCSMEGRLTSLNAFTAETLGYRPEDLWGAW
jgi:hypothetical protein